MIFHSLKLFRFSSRPSLSNLMQIDQNRFLYQYFLPNVTSDQITLNKLPITIIGVPSTIESQFQLQEHTKIIRKKLDSASKSNTTFCFGIDNHRAILAELFSQQRKEKYFEGESVLNHYLSIDQLKEFQQICIEDCPDSLIRQEIQKSWNNRFAYRLLLKPPLQNFIPEYEKFMFETIGHVIERGKVKLVRLPRQLERILQAHRGLNETKMLFQSLINQLAKYQDKPRILRQYADMDSSRMRLQLGYLLLNINRLAFQQSDLENLVIVLQNPLTAPLKDAILQQNDQIILETDLKKFTDLFINQVTPEDLIESIAILDVLDDHQSWNENSHGPEAFLRTPISKMQAMGYSRLYETFQQKYMAQLDQLGFNY